MTDLLNRGAALLSRTLASRNAVTVTYTRGAHSVTLTGSAGSMLLRLQDEYGGSRVERTDRDFLFAAAALVLNGVRVTPERGDVIAESAGGKDYTFTVLPYSGEPCWRWADAGRTLIRVHTKKTAEEDS